MTKGSRRPRIGLAVVRGLKLGAQKLRREIDAGYVPSAWTVGNRQDVQLALKYVERLSYWYSLGRHLKGENVVDMTQEPKNE